MKFPKPFFRKAKKAWYLQLGKRQISLGKNREEAFNRYQQILLHERGQGTPSDFNNTLAAAQICDLFLDWCQRHNDSDTYEWYRYYLQDFCGGYGDLPALDVKPFHVTRWLDRHDTWGEGSRRSAITSLKRVYNWAESEGLLAGNPVKKIRKPKGRSRDRILNPHERNNISGTVRDQAFRNMLLALQETGCRPSEVARVTAADANLEEKTWVLTKHKTAKRINKPRIIYLTAVMVELTRILMAAHPSGPLFLNSRGQPWTRNAIRCRFRRLRTKIPHLKGVVSYSYRHTFVTEALVNGVPAATVAELVGHKDLRMIQDHYAHLAEKRDHLRQAAEQATLPRRA